MAIVNGQYVNGQYVNSQWLKVNGEYLRLTMTTHYSLLTIYPYLLSGILLQ